ncbi:hypothetical protein [Sphingomonas sp. ERG5]|uniref:hypothetical protein n=1 Tax=Sphingomonas sp. ERG5 TaxID=1381597 RepID=UPI001269B468|nr:hypothetical protein [Sphingomonas sp. ERG5]
MIGRRCALLAMACAALLLSGCWSGPAWFAASEGVAAIPDGRYRLVEPGTAPESADILTIARQADNSFSITGPDIPWRAIIVPVDTARPGRFVVQLQQAPAGQPSANAGFVLLDTNASTWRIAVPRCAGAAQKAVERSGGHVSSDPQTGASCIFTDRAALLAQLRGAVKEEGGFDLELVKADR